MTFDNATREILNELKSRGRIASEQRDYYVMRKCFQLHDTIFLAAWHGEPLPELPKKLPSIPAYKIPAPL